MLNNQADKFTNENNQGSVVAQTAHPSLEDSLKQEIQSLKKEVKSLKAQSRWNSGIIGLGVIGLIGYAIATNWSAFAAAGTATAAALPVIGIAVATIVAATVLVGASYLAWRYRAEIKAGFKHAAEKTVEGAKYTAGKIKAGAVRAKDSVKEAASSLKQAAREGTSSALEKIGEGVQNLGRKISDRGASISDLERIPYPKQESQGVVLLGKRELDPDLIDSNKDFQKDSSQSNSFSRSSSTSSLNSNSTNGSTAVLPNPKEHKAVKVPTSLLNKIPSWFKGNKKSGQTEVKYQVFPEGRSAENSTFYIDNPIYSAGTTATAASGEQSTLPESADKTATVGKQPSGKQPIQAPENSVRSDSPDSGIGSSTSDSDKPRLNTTGNLDKQVKQPPSSKVGGNVNVQRQVGQGVEA